MYNTRIESIEVSEGRAVALITDSGERIIAKQIISNASPHKVYASLITPLSAVPKLAYQAANARRVGPTAYVLYLGLNKSCEELGFKNYSYFIYPTMDTEKLYEDMSKRDTAKVQATICLNLANPDCSPKGTTIMSFTTLFTEGAWDDVTPENYFKEKNKIADRMIDYFEASTGIKIRDAIEEVEVATPVTFANYTGAYAGSIYGYEPDSWDSFLPRMMMMEEDTLIKNLRFVGGFSFRAHGYSSSYQSGDTVALLAARDVKEGK